MSWWEKYFQKIITPTFRLTLQNFCSSILPSLYSVTSPIISTNFLLVRFLLTPSKKHFIWTRTRTWFICQVQLYDIYDMWLKKLYTYSRETKAKVHTYLYRQSRCGIVFWPRGKMTPDQNTILTGVGVGGSIYYHSILTPPPPIVFWPPPTTTHNQPKRHHRLPQYIVIWY